MKIRSLKTAGMAVAAALALASPLAAAETTLRAITAFQPGTTFAKPFEDFVSKVNAQGEGLLKIEVIGGPEAMPPFEIGNALRNGIVDIANTTAVFHASLVPEGVAMTLATRPMSELRENGGYALMNQLHEDKARIHWLGRLTQGINYHIYLNEAPEGGKLDGLKLRSVPVYQAFFKDLGATPMQTAPGEVYTALERGVIDGYGWPSIGVFDLGWQDKTGARVNPGFYQVETGLYLSLKTWQSLSEEQQAFLSELMIETESSSSLVQDLAEAEKAKQIDAGIEMIDLDADAATEFGALAQESGWKPILATSPEHGAKLRELFAD